MAIRVFNTLSGQKEPFIPLREGQVSFYVCGVTVYDYCHIGHARAYVVFDTIRRYLTARNYQVRYVQNFTDIDDKIIQRAALKDMSVTELTETMIQAYFDDMDQLNIQRADSYPRATGHMAEIFEIIQSLLDKNAAYITPSGDVCYSVEAFPPYGKLSKKILDDLVAGARVDVSDQKRNPADFVLWKPSKPGEPAWESPWGAGRPGWHIECSAMAIHELGSTIDIHGGGEDLIFPHHENEIAQSEAHTGQPFAKYWVHNGFVTINDEKMSKSKKNTYSIREILGEYAGEVLRFYLLRSHYRTPFNFSKDGLDESFSSLTRLHKTLATFPVHADPAVDIASDAHLSGFNARFLDAMNDDFNFAGAVGILFELNKFIHREKRGSALLGKLGAILGLFFSDLSSSSPVDEISDEITQLIDERNKSRTEKDFKRSDEIRAQLLGMGIQLEDSKEGTRWSRIQPA